MRGDPRQRLDYELARHWRLITALSTHPSRTAGERPMGDNSATGMGRPETHAAETLR